MYVDLSGSQVRGEAGAGPVDVGEHAASAANDSDDARATEVLRHGLRRF